MKNLSYIQYLRDPRLYQTLDYDYFFQRQDLKYFIKIVFLIYFNINMLFFLH